ncbi:M4 family metallopeptidase [Nocardioides sp. zg-1228]|uniref:M4 family metallopeptidase n=1 Tax=Nocardioides sp. zg-1228 TaxID=2763008 RepID=UPI0016429685|nr:M4 family metallopeptidase [Nocardioides sp. zg-1228]MBC2934334.1 M4 family metallopeptidase [Nocardioides sp. zg-1228]QSF59112.1 M4 family metallopeptidase [Nocardioides sp. zg-1228]
MKLLNRGLALAVVGAGLAAVPTLGVQATAAPSAEPSLLSQLRDQAEGSVAISKEAATGKAGFVRTNGDLLPGRAARDAAGASAKADAYLDEFAGVLGARSSELEQVRVDAGPLGWTVTYTQAYQGVPVFGSTLKANVDKQGDLTSVTGYAAPDLSLSTTPATTAGEAGEAAVAIVKEFPPTSADSSAADTTGLRAGDAELVVYRKGSVKGEDGDAVLAWQVDVSNVTAKGGSVHDVLFLDATSLKPVNRYSRIHEALDRELLTVTDDGGTPDEVSDDVRERVWQEGDPFPGALDQDQQNLLISSEETYNLYANMFGRDSWDGAGARMITVHNRSDRCPNASWNGTFASYCPGVYDDDTVAHEWSHAYTQETSGLIYQWQAGALNESMSDVFGEVVDLVNNREDEGEGDLSAKRPDGLCSTHSPALPQLTINSPSSIAKDCLTGGASFGRPLTGAGISGDVAAPTDAVEAGGGTNLDGCSPYDQDVTGKVVLVNRGLCSFEEKAEVATAEGAAALIIGNREEAPLGMSGADQTLVSTVSIGLSDRESIRTAIASGATVNVTMRDVGGDRFDSYRWLLSEKSSAFGGAIRDMWNPTCHGDPGKVSDAEYKCGTDDAGGVHSNSGVPNHAFALAVDGGAYNGQTSTGLGLDKAVNLWWRAQSAYLTPTSDFTDLADGLEASCADLTGKPINKITLGAGDVQPAAPITAADCGELAKVISATELRKEPVQCDFQPLLDPSAPSLCGDGFVTDVAWSEDFEDGLAGWTAGKEVVYPGGLNEPWVSTSVEGHPGKVAFGPAPDKGECSGTAGDFSSRDSISSPVVEVGEMLHPKLTFDHSVSTELGYDGGNLKVSINGGAFETVPADAYLYNAPIELAEAGNTNPLAGEPGFTGTDGGTLKSGWGTSVVDMDALGLVSGDTMQLRFDIGRDGCGGVIGWSVDNVKLVDCKLPTKVAVVRKPEPSTFGEASTVDVTVSRDGSVGSAPTGTVKVTDAAGKELGTAELGANGKATVALPADLPIGANALTASYLGNRTQAPSKAAFTATVVGASSTKARSKTKVTVKPSRPKAGTKVTFVVKVKADVKVTGKVTVKIGGKKYKATVKKGKATVSIAKGLKAGKYKAKATYLGSDTVKRSTDTVKFTVRR